MKKILTLMVVLLIGFVLVACGGNDDPNGQTQTISLSYADWGNQEFNQKMIDAFELKYPNL